MGFIKRIFDPDPPEFQMQEVEDVPSFEDEQRELDEKRKLEEAERKRKGRRSTILTGGQGLNEIEDDEINKRTLLGG